MKLRIAHVLSSISDLATGPAQSVPAMCNELASLGHHVELHVLDYGGAVERSEQRYRLHAYPYWRGTARIGFSPAMESGLRAAAKRVDIIHWHGLWMMPNVYPYLAARGQRCRLVVSPRGMLEAPAWQRSKVVKAIAWRLIQERALQAAQLVHATSIAETASVRACGLDQPVATVPNGVYLPPDSSVAEARARRGQRRRLLFLGRIHPIKGLDRLLKAWARVQDVFPAWDLALVGPGVEQDVRDLKQLAKTLNARATFEPAVFGDELTATFARADLYVLASHSENFAMSVAEALAAGVPVLCSRGAPWQQLEDNGCGYWVSNDVDSLEAALRVALSQDREALTEMGNRGRDWMSRAFAWSAKAAQLAEAYRWLVDGGAAPACVQTQFTRELVAPPLRKLGQPRGAAGLSD